MSFVPPELLTVTDLRAVPFSAYRQQSSGSNWRLSGIIRLEPSALVVEGSLVDPYANQWGPSFQQLFGIVPKFMGEFALTIPYADLDHIEVRTGWFLTYERTGIFRQAVVLSVKRLGLLKPLPEAEKGTLSLPVAKANLHAAQALVSRAALLAQHYRLSV